MDRFKYIIKWIFNPFFVKKPEHYKIVALCIAVATIFWFFNAFNKTYTTAFTYPINYQYNHEKFTPLTTFKTSVKISLTGQGWDLLKEYFSLDKKYIDVPLASEPGKAQVPLSLLKMSANEKFNKFNVNQVLADSIICNLDYKINKLITIKLSKDSIKINNGFSLSSEIEITPKEVYITGPASVINKINNPYYIDLDEEVDGDFDDKVNLILPEKTLCDITRVKVKFDLSPYVEIEKEFIYLIKGNNDSTLIFSPKKLIGNYYLPEYEKDKITDSSIVIILDIKEFIYKHDTILSISKIVKPDFVRRVVLEDSLIKISRLYD